MLMEPGVRFDKERMKMVKKEELVESDRNMSGDARKVEEDF